MIGHVETSKNAESPKGKGKGKAPPNPPPSGLPKGHGKGSTPIKALTYEEPSRRSQETSLVQAIVNPKAAIMKKLQAKAKVFKDRNIGLDDVMSFIEDKQKALGKSIDDAYAAESRNKIKIIGAALCRLFYSATAHLCENVVLSQIGDVLEKVKELLILTNKWFDGEATSEPKIDAKFAFWLQDAVYPIYRGGEKVESLENVLKNYKEIRKTMNSKVWDKTVEDFFRSVLQNRYGALLSAARDKKPLQLHISKFEPQLHTLKCESTINDRMMPSLQEFEVALVTCLDAYVAEKASGINQLIAQAEFHFSREAAEATQPRKTSGTKINDAQNIFKALGGSSEQQPFLIKLTKLQAGKYRSGDRKLGFYSALLGLARFISCCFPKNREVGGVGQYFNESLATLTSTQKRVNNQYGCRQHYPVYLKKSVYNENFFEFLKTLLDSMILEFYRISYNKDEKPKPKEPQDLFNARITNLKKSDREDPPSTYWKLSSFLKATLLHKEGIQLAIETLAQGYEGAAMLDRLLERLAMGDVTKEQGRALYKEAFAKTDLVDKLFLALTIAEEFLTMLYRGEPSPRCTSRNSEVMGPCIDSPNACEVSKEDLTPVAVPKKVALIDEECKERLCPERGDCPNLEKNFGKWAKKLHPDKNPSARATADFQRLSACRESLRTKVRPVVVTPIESSLHPPSVPTSPRIEDLPTTPTTTSSSTPTDEDEDHAEKLCQLMGCKADQTLKECRTKTKRKNSVQDEEFIEKWPGIECERDAEHKRYTPSSIFKKVSDVVRTGWRTSQ